MNDRKTGADIKDKLQQNSLKEVLSGMRRIIGYKTPGQLGDENKKKEE